MHAFAIALREIFTDRVFFAVLAVAVASAAVLYEVRGEDAVLAALDADFRLFAVLLVFLPPVLFLAAYFEVLMPIGLIEKWLGSGSGLKGILVATVAGAFTPGGPWLAFPVVVALQRAGADWGPLVAYVSSWSLLAVSRIFVFELPLLGPRFVIVRYAASLVLPVIAGIIASQIVRVWKPPKREEPEC